MYHQKEISNINDEISIWVDELKSITGEYNIPDGSKWVKYSAESQNKSLDRIEYFYRNFPNQNPEMARVGFLLQQYLDEIRRLLTTLESHEHSIILMVGGIAFVVVFSFVYLLYLDPLFRKKVYYFLILFIKYMDDLTDKFFMTIFKIIWWLCLKTVGK